MKMKKKWKWKFRWRRFESKSIGHIENELKGLKSKTVWDDIDDKSNDFKWMELEGLSQYTRPSFWVNLTLEGKVLCQK